LASLEASLFARTRICFSSHISRDLNLKIFWILAGVHCRPAWQASDTYRLPWFLYPIPEISQWLQRCPSGHA
jgi:hypothetical protein